MEQSCSGALLARQVVCILTKIVVPKAIYTHKILKSHVSFALAVGATHNTQRRDQKEILKICWARVPPPVREG
jgi:hypothetical protein